MERRLAAIVAMDMVGYTRRMQVDEVETLAAVKADRERIVDPKVEQHSGRTIKLMGDGALLEFPSVVNAVLFAVEVQTVFGTRNAAASGDEGAHYRIGINIGDVIIEGDDVYGEGVNLAARLEGQAEPGGICISDTVHREVKDRLDLDFEDRGEVEVKNVTGPVRIFFIRQNEKTERLATPIVKLPGPGKRKPPAAALAAAAVCLLVAITALAWWQPWADQIASEKGQQARALPKKPSIAVLPFRNLGGNADNAYLADGFTNAVITNLSRFPELFVASGNSTFSYKGKTPKAGDVGRELGVRYVLLGTYHQTDKNTRISAQLIDAGQDASIWAENFDVARNKIIETQEEITRITASTLVSVIHDRSRMRALRLKDEDSLEAYDLYLRATKFKLSKAAVADNIANLERAVSLEPDFAAAYALLSYRYTQTWRLNLADAPEQALDKARQSAQKALELDPLDYRVHDVLCTLHLYADRKHELALSECERAVSLNPNDPGIQVNLAQVLAFMGRADEGLKWMASAKRLNPLFQPHYDWTSSFIHALAGNHDVALVEAERALAVYTKSLSLRRIKIFSLVELGRLDEAKQVAGEILEIAPGFTLAKLRNAPHQPPAQLKRVLDSFRKAGLPDE